MPWKSKCALSAKNAQKFLNLKVTGTQRSTAPKVSNKRSSKAQRPKNNAEGQASAIKAVAHATADGLQMVAASLGSPCGRDAAQLRVAEEYVKQFAAMAKATNTMILPANLAEISGLISTAMTTIKSHPQGQVN